MVQLALPLIGYFIRRASFGSRRKAGPSLIMGVGEVAGSNAMGLEELALLFPEAYGPSDSDHPAQLPPTPTPWPFVGLP